MDRYYSHLSYSNEGAALSLPSTKCLVAAVIDEKVIKRQDLESNLNAAWKLREPFWIDGVANNLFVIYFACEHDLQYVLENAPWVVKNTFIAIESWNPDMIPVNDKIEVSPIWVQFSGLPMDYHNPMVAEFLGNIVGDTMFREYQQVIFEDSASFLKVRVKVDTTLPLIQKIKFLSADNGNDHWIHCTYERVHRCCRKCCRIGHVARDCKWKSREISEALNKLKDRIRGRFLVDIEIGIKVEAPGDVRVNATKHTALIQWLHGPTEIGSYQVIEKSSSSYGGNIPDMMNYQSDYTGSTPYSTNENDAAAVTSQIYNQVHSEIVEQHDALTPWMALGCWSQVEDSGASNLNFHHGPGEEMIQPNTDMKIDPNSFSGQNLVAAYTNQQAMITQELYGPCVDDNKYNIQEGLFNQGTPGFCWNCYA